MAKTQRVALGLCQVVLSWSRRLQLLHLLQSIAASVSASCNQPPTSAKTWFVRHFIRQSRDWQVKLVSSRLWLEAYSWIWSICHRMLAELAYCSLHAILLSTCYILNTSHLQAVYIDNFWDIIVCHCLKLLNAFLALCKFWHQIAHDLTNWPSALQQIFFQDKTAQIWIMKMLPFIYL